MEKHNLIEKYKPYDFKNNLQTTIIKIIFPFSINPNNIASLKETILKSGKWFNYPDILISKSSRHFDHIESLRGVDFVDYTYDEHETKKMFRIIDQNIIDSYIELPKFIFDTNKQIEEEEILLDELKKAKDQKYSECISRLQNYHSILYNYKESQQDLSKAISSFGKNNHYNPFSVSVIIFSTGVFFLNVEIGTTKIQTEYDHNKMNIYLKQYFKAINLERLLEHIWDAKGAPIKDKLFKCKKVKDKENSLFDKYGINAFDTSGNDTTRFQIYCDVKVNQVMGKTSSRHILYNPDDNYSKKLACYYLDRNSERRIQKCDSIISQFSLFPHNNTYISSEGILVFSEKTVDNIHSTRLVSYLKNEQNSFFTYMLVLHQYYALHCLARDVKKILELGRTNENQKIKITNIGKISDELSKISLKISILQTKFMHKAVSQFARQQELYSQINKVYGIEQFMEEVNDSIEPLDEYVKKSKSDVLDITFKGLTLFTVSNAILSIWISSNHDAWQGTKIWLPFLIIGFFIAGFIAVVVVLNIINYRKISKFRKVFDEKKRK